jgi:hypothetical protein
MLVNAQRHRGRYLSKIHTNIFVQVTPASQRVQIMGRRQQSFSNFYQVASQLMPRCVGTIQMECLDGLYEVA